MADLSIAEVPVEDIVRDIFGGVAVGSAGVPPVPVGPAPPNTVQVARSEDQ